MICTAYPLHGSPSIFLLTMRRVKAVLGSSAAKAASTSLFPLFPSGGGKPLTASTVAIRPPPQPPDEPDPIPPPPDPPPLNDSLSYHQFANRASNLTTPANNRPRCHFPLLLLALIPSLSPFKPLKCSLPYRSISPKFPHHQGFYPALPGFLNHSFYNASPSTLNGCLASEEKHPLWASKDVERSSTILVRPKKVLATDDVWRATFLRALTMSESECGRVVDVEPKEEKLVKALVLQRMTRSLCRGTHLRYPCFEDIIEVFDENPVVGWVSRNILLIELKCTEMVLDSKNHHHRSNQIHSTMFFIVSPIPSSLSLLDTQRCMAKLSCIWNNLSKVSRSGLYDHEGSGKTLDVDSYPKVTVSQYKTQQGGPVMVGPVARDEVPKCG